MNKELEQMYSRLMDKYRDRVVNMVGELGDNPPPGQVADVTLRCTASFVFDVLVDALALNGD